jgi:hypothetical protein
MAKGFVYFVAVMDWFSPSYSWHARDSLADVA